MKNESFAETDDLVATVVTRVSESGGVNVVIGPVVYEQIATGRQWYFVMASGKEFEIDKLVAKDKFIATHIRSSLRMGLCSLRPLVLHDMDDELEMARWCASIWPGSKAAAIVASIELERAG